MARPLPFAGYSWQTSQHQSIFEEEKFIGLLATAALFEHRANYTTEINAVLAQSNILTENRRDGVASPWRDYQQVLPEIGAMVSAQISRHLTITEIGRSLLAGGLSYPAFMTLQVLRYQYPNGFKGTTFDRFRNVGVEVRPAVMLLRGLIALREQGIDGISIDQIRAYFLPNRIDAEWPLSVAEVMAGGPLSRVNDGVRRNLSDWVKLLDRTKLFRFDGVSLSLTGFSIENMMTIRNVADVIIASPIWQPISRASAGPEWFAYYGSFRNILPALENIIEIGEVPETAISDSLDVETSGREAQLILTDFMPLSLTLANVPEATDDLVHAYRNGQAKLAFARQEHDKLVNSVARYYAQLGWQSRYGADSIDLLVSHPEGQTRIIEVKTTNQRTLGKQVRTAVGQLLEYRYRYALHHPPATRCDVILNHPFPADDWRRAFCAENGIHMDCFSNGAFLFQ